MGILFIIQSLSLTAIIPELSELGTIDIEVTFSDYQEVTYELSKYSIPFYINGKEKLKGLLGLLIDLLLPFSVSYEPIKGVAWNRYVVSIEGVKTTKITELVAMLRVLKVNLNQIYQLLK